MTEAWQIGGYRTDTLAGKVVKCGTFSATLNNSGACFKVLGADYAVTAGKTFYLCGIYIVSDVNTTGTNTALTYADNTALTTNPVAVGFATTAATIAAGNIDSWIPLVGLTVPAGKYFGLFQAGAVAQLHVWLMIGYEA